MTAQALLEALEARGARLRPRADGALEVEPGSLLGPEDREALRAHKPAVVSLLRERQERRP